jgi:hypothetical protein
MTPAAILIILIGFNATAVETNSMNQCLALQEFTNKELSRIKKPDEYAVKCFYKLGGKSYGS